MVLAQFRDNAQLLTRDIFCGDSSWAAGGFGSVRPLDPVLSSLECGALASSALSFSRALFQS